jgi:hypothetical protein
MSELDSAIGALKISDKDDEDLEIGPDDSASKVAEKVAEATAVSVASGKTDTTSVISIASDASGTSVASQSSNQLITVLYKRAMKKITVLEDKIEELTEKLAQATSSGSPLKRKKKDAEFNMTLWNTKITETGYFKSNGGKSVFNSNTARLAYVTLLMDFYNTSDFSTKTTFDTLFTKVNGKYPAFQSLLDAVPVPFDFGEGCSLLAEGSKKVTSKYVKVSVDPMAAMPMAAMTMAAQMPMAAMTMAAQME